MLRRRLPIVDPRETLLADRERHRVRGARLAFEVFNAGDEPFAKILDQVRVIFRRIPIELLNCRFKSFPDRVDQRDPPRRRIKQGQQFLHPLPISLSPRIVLHHRPRQHEALLGAEPREIPPNLLELPWNLICLIGSN